MSESGRPLGEKSTSIWTTRSHLPGHRRHDSCVRKTSIKSDFSGYATHETPITSLFYPSPEHAKEKAQIELRLLHDIVYPCQIFKFDT